MTSDLVERLRAHGDQSPIKNSAEWIDFASLYLVEAAARIERLEAALRKIAAYEEGPVVTGRFDEPWSASLARAALEGK